ncbi:chloride channel protein [Parasediminibacterium sp. JCM 36343]|uniref:chloride channel protein n=1 Tax=Parasediminibacterium sp. JCM 36343 TaxID=3374279 RepID=UPI00397A2513
MNVLQAIKRKLKEKYDAIDNRKFKENLLNALPFWVGAFATGVVAVGYAKLFAFAESGTAYLFHRASWLFFLVTPACFLLAWWVVKQYAPYSRGSGIPQVSAALELSNPKHSYNVSVLLSLRVAIVKIISSLIMVFGGGVVGREGPTIQISASIFKQINDWLPAWYPKISKRNMIVTGAAAGLASAFNTPLGGIVFAIEELTKTHFSFFKSALLTGVIIAGLTALTFLGPYLYLGYPPLDRIPPSIILLILPVAFFAGIVGSSMGTILLFVFKKKASLKKEYQKYLYAIVCGLIVAMLGVLISSKTFGSGKEIMVATLFTNDKHLDWYIPLLRMIGPIVSFSNGAAGGIFAPALSLGASIGAVLAGWMHLSVTETNLIILCGMTGCLTGVTRSPFTCSILVLEMTNSHNIIFYIMLTALCANLVSNMVGRHSFYDSLKDQYIREIHKAEAQLSKPNLD